MPAILSVILPAYNESSRLPPYLTAIRCCLDGTFPNAYEVIVVDDGSKDGLATRVDRIRADWPQLTLLRHERNRGKGAAVRTGMEVAQGDLLLFADADGATPIAEEARLRDAIRQGASVAVGSRLLRSKDKVVGRHLYRDVPGRIFACLAHTLFGLSVWDTQCGFKIFRREVLPSLLGLCCESGYLFDLEILAWAHRLGYRIAEVPVSWRDVPGSKVRLLRDGWSMLRGLLRLRRALGRAVLPRPSALLAPACIGNLPETRGSDGFPSLERQVR